MSSKKFEHRRVVVLAGKIPQQYVNLGHAYSSLLAQSALEILVNAFAFQWILAQQVVTIARLGHQSGTRGDLTSHADVGVHTQH